MLVKGFGPTSARICFVGEAPGVREEELGRPFVGASGGLLRVMVADAGMSLDTCRLENIMQTRPEGNNFDCFYEDGKKRKVPKPELIIGRERLLADLKELKPNLIVALGNEPLRALTGKTGIDKWRGSILDSPAGKVIPTYHPAAILRKYEWRPVAQVDFTRCCSEQFSPETRIPQLATITAPSFNRVMCWLDGAETFADSMCTFDIETLGQKIRCLGLSVKDNEAICIPFIRVQQFNQHKAGKINLVFQPQSTNPSYWTEIEELAIIKRLSKFFLSQKIRFVAQNVGFDLSLLEQNYGLQIPNFWFDTMHAQHLAYPELPMSLDFLTSVYTRIGYYAGYDPASDIATWRYNCLDCIATRQCVPKIIQELKELEMLDFYFNHLHLTVLATVQLQNRGVLIDVVNREKLGEPLRVELAEIREKMKKRYGLEFNIQASPKKLKEVLTSLGIPIPIRRGKETTDRRALDGLVAKYPQVPLFRMIIDQRTKQKFYGTYVTSRLDDDDRMRSSINVSGTKTGRVSSSKTLWDTGGNLQNIPRTDFRRMFIVPAGKLFLHVDLAQAETRIISWECRDKDIIDRFVNDPTFDIHRLKASQIFSVAEQEVTPDQRYRGKQSNHSGNYGISWKKFAYINQIPFQEAKEILAAHQSYPPLRDWWERVQTQLKANRTLVTAYGRKRIFFGRLDEETFREAYNHLAQSTVGDIINETCWRLMGSLDSDRCAMILQVHDELDFEVEKEYLDEACQIIKRALVVPLHYDGLPDLVIPAEFSVGINWFDQKEIKV